MRVLPFCILVSITVLVGCARVTTTTTLHADGSFSRKVMYTVTKATSGLGGITGGDKAPTKDKPEDYFKLPAGGVRKEDKNGITLTSTREVAAGAGPVQDISLLADKGKMMATSTVTVKKLPDGNIEYVETLHALQQEAKSQQMMVPDLRARVKKAIPAEFQKTETIDALTREVMVNFGHALLGPPEPNLFNIMFTPDVTARRVNATAYASNIKSFKTALPGITDAQATLMAKSLTDLINQEALGGASGPGEATSPSEDSGPNFMTPLFFSVGFSGTLVESNGLLDPVTGEVYWSLLAASMDFGDVELRVVVKPN